MPTSTQLDLFGPLLPPVPVAMAPPGVPPPSPKPAPAPPAPAAAPPIQLQPDELLVEGRAVRIRYERHPRARRYRLTWLRDGTARCTVPSRGSLAEARRFVERCREWLAGRIRQDAGRPSRQSHWSIGTRVWFRGEEVPIAQASGASQVALGDWVIPVPAPLPADLRPHVEGALMRLAAGELPARVIELAEPHGLPVRRVSVRNQRSRWGSCSRRGTISLNWRLVQVPLAVRDYILLHELAHLRHMNHSERFWTEVRRLCPDYEAAERWLRQHGRHLI